MVASVLITTSTLHAGLESYQSQTHLPSQRAQHTCDTCLTYSTSTSTSTSRDGSTSGRSSSSRRVSRSDTAQPLEAAATLAETAPTPWWTCQWLAGCTSGFGRASRTRHGGERTSWHRVDRQAPLWIEGCGIKVPFIWSGTCLLFIGGWPWHTSFTTAGAATTATAGERTTRGHGLRRRCCGGREVPQETECQVGCLSTTGCINAIGAGSTVAAGTMCALQENRAKEGGHFTHSDCKTWMHCADVSCHHLFLCKAPLVMSPKQAASRLVSGTGQPARNPTWRPSEVVHQM